MRRTPITVVTGGPEATEFAARLQAGLAGAATPERVVVVAEGRAPAAAPVEDWLTLDAVEGRRTEDCDCCRSRLDLVDAVRQVLERPCPAQRMIVLVDPGRDTTTVVQTILAEPHVQRLADLDGVLATTDATALATRSATGLPFGTALELQRLAIADRILVARALDVTDEALGRAMRSLRTVNRLGLIAAPSVVPVDMAALVDLRAWHGAPTVSPGVGAEPVSTGDGGGIPTTVHCEVEGELDPTAVDEWFDHLIARHGPRLLRLQGAVSVRGHARRVCCRGVRSFAISHSEDEHPTRRRSSRSIVAIVGHGLDGDALRHEFEATRAR